MGKVVELTVSKGKTVKAVVEDQADLEAAKAHLEGLLDGWLTSIGAKPFEAKPTTTSKPSPGPELFPEDLRQLLSFEEREGSFIIKPRQFLGAENFARIADIVKAQGGEYVSQGKNSHFKIPLNGGK